MQPTLRGHGVKRLERSCRRRPDSIRFGPSGYGVERAEVYLSACAFEPHRHDTYAIGLTTAGVQTFRYRGSSRVCLPGQLHVLHPDETHDGAAGTNDGFGYRMLYIAPELVRDALAGHALPFVEDPVQESTATGRPIAALLGDIDEPINELSSAEIAATVADALLSLSGRPHHRRATIDHQGSYTRARLFGGARARANSGLDPGEDRGRRPLHDHSPFPMGVRDESGPLPDAAPPRASPRRDRGGRVTRPSRRRCWLRRPESHDTPLQAELRLDSRPLDDPHRPNSPVSTSPIGKPAGRIR